MLTSVAEMVEDLESTAERISKNEAALKSIEGNALFTEEYHALHKMQVGLLSHLDHMDALIAKERPTTTLEKRIAAVRTKILQIADLGAIAPTVQKRRARVIKRSIARRRKCRG
ncbi:MAG: hypothetical protein SNF33_00780 [Candidatus Algichlamydia australiensis]|nr:hypothetical protein [Chlamydiales bacterium]